MKWISGFRSFLYQVGLIKAVELPAFTLSVGNLSWGGTGKSPFVSLLATYFLKQNISTLLLSRGYGRKERRALILPGDKPLPPADKTGDEPWMIRSRNPGLAMAVHPRRARIAKRSWLKLGAPQLVLLDDGFQHWRAVRDFDVVMIDATEAFLSEKKNFVRFRESPRALARADLVILTRSNEVDSSRLQQWRSEITEYQRKSSNLNPWKRKKYSIPSKEILECGYYFRGFVDGESGKPVAADSLKRPILITGIAKPESFVQVLRAQGVECSEEIVLSDHGDLSLSLRSRLRKEKPKLLMTEKDWARWRSFCISENIPAVFAEVEMRFLGDSQQKLNSILEGISKCITSA